MAHNLAVRTKEQIFALWKMFLSLRKHDWVFSDYPVLVKKQEIDPDYVGTRLKQSLYVAQIVNWQLSDSGDTPEQAKDALGKQFATVKLKQKSSGERLPRPGTKVPLQFASQERMNRNSELAEDFIRRVLELDWAWLSDESSLWDFHAEDDNDALISKIQEVYGVDVSDIESAKLSEILERIDTNRSDRHDKATQ